MNLLILSGKKQRSHKEPAGRDGQEDVDGDERLGLQAQLPVLPS